MEKIVFEPNVTETVALKFPEGRLVEGRFGDQMYYTLTDGRAMYLDLDVAAKINGLELRRAEPFNICKRWSGKKGAKPQWDVWRPDGATTPRVQQPDPETQQDQDLRQSFEQRGAGASTPTPAAGNAGSVTTAYSNGNGSRVANGNGHHGGNGVAVANGNGNGNGHNGVTAPPAPPPPPTPPQRPYVAAGIPTPPTKVPYGKALKCITRTAIRVLKEEGEQWSDAARQDLVSTLMIQAARDGVVSWVDLGKEVE